MAPTIVQFAPLPSQTHPSFWHKLTELKLDVLKLSDAEVDIIGSYGVGKLIKDREGGPGAYVGVTGSLSVEEQSFGQGHPPSISNIAAKGTVKNYNTIEEFKAADKTKLFNEAADKIWTSVQTTKSTSLLNSFLLITFADLKKYKYYYWFAFPAFVSTPAWHIDSDAGWSSVSAPNSGLAHNQLTSIHDQLSKSSKSLPYFLVRSSDPEVAEIVPVEQYDPQTDSSSAIGFIDPSAQAQNPGWPLRNLLAYLRALHPNISVAKVLCWRDAEVAKEVGEWKSRIGLLTVGDGSTPTEVKAASTRPNAVGWEKNVQGKLGPRMADLAPMMDPARLANQAVDLNLKLMRWRILPSLDLDKIAATKCLLLGAGTLGCYVARCLMGWGVRNITLVDSGRVSFSNPVRQPLFHFSDCLNGGRPKAECAAERLKEVWPGINATGHTLSIPMPGHPIPSSPPSILEDTKKQVEKLEKLIEEHDAVYLLMDSRESRWLPTVIGRAKGKLVLNAALGFDTFLVMRHGARPDQSKVEATDDPRKNLGCYYCNDIVAPADSLTDRTLDQMCTVTRPGIASMAASTAVELMMSVLQHPEGIHAPAPKLPSTTSTSTFTEEGEEGTSVLGLIPHQLRGYLAQFRNLHIVGAAYDRCTGCSETVVKAYETQGFDFMLKAFNDPKYLEQLTGLDKLFEEGEKALGDVEWAEEDGEDGDDF
ncbi:E1-like protein-activating [Dendrothele bispora CBS 962.96]|uniref:Ubiquitin-like modifier-activating enzyme ATG7 n=1 Tax=Dendrothele bispora (strain CBS 962.96) TaxID=1314807 RepID=A0A4S8MQF8_DENBC|nr:E1-like protein-activating [Dendrothele bispora CBS 962.96]